MSLSWFIHGAPEARLDSFDHLRPIPNHPTHLPRDRHDVSDVSGLGRCVRSGGEDRVSRGTCLETDTVTCRHVRRLASRPCLETDTVTCRHSRGGLQTQSGRITRVYSRSA